MLKIQKIKGFIHFPSTYLTKWCRHFLGSPVSKNIIDNTSVISVFSLNLNINHLEGQLTAEVVQCADENQSYGCNKTHRWPQNKGTTATWSKHTTYTGHGFI